MLSLFGRMLPQTLPPPRMAVERHLRTVASDPARMIGALLDRYGLSDGDVGNGDDGGAPYDTRSGGAPKILIAKLCALIVAVPGLEPTLVS